MEDRDLRAGLYNISLNNNREDIIRAFLEGVAFNTRWLLKPVEKFMSRRVEQINLVGGGGNSDVWCQIFADVLNVEVRQVKDPIQANARGAAFIAGAGWDRSGWRCAAAWSSSSTSISPRRNTGKCMMIDLRSLSRFIGR